MDTIIRVNKDYDADPFARIDKIPINDPSLSYKALGILTYVLSKPDGWEVNIKDLANHATDGIKAIRSGISELELNQYVRRYKLIDSVNKRVLKWLYQFYERPYIGDLVPFTIVEIVKPVTHNGIVDNEPLSGFLQVEKPQVEKLQVENGTPINNVVKQLISNTQLTKEYNNNNGGQVTNSKSVVVIPKRKQKKYTLIEKRILNLGWVGSLNTIKTYYLKDSKYLNAWVEKTESIKGLANPAGFLRKSLRSGVKPLSNEEKETNALLGLGLSMEEIKELT